MTKVSVSQLKAQLSRYLREVRRGGEVQVLDRGRPIARLIGLGSAAAEPDEDRRRRLIEAGVLEPRTGSVDALLQRPPIQLSTSLLEALEEERGDRV